MKMRVSTSRLATVRCSSTPNWPKPGTTFPRCKHSYHSPTLVGDFSFVKSSICVTIELKLIIGANAISSLIQAIALLYSSGFSNKLAILLIWWLFWPGLIFLVGVICESRLIPVAKGQSKAFWPGDLSLGIAFVALIGLHTVPGPDWGYSAFWWLSLALAMLIVAFFLRKRDAKNYPKRAAFSPTKLTHDLIGYFIIPTLLIGLGVPKLFQFLLAADWQNWLVFVMAMAFYAICVIYDAKKGFTKEDLAARHPSTWTPIWKGKKE